VNGNKTLYLVLFIGFFVLGLSLGSLAGYGNWGGRRELTERFEQVTRDLASAVESQREASDRAARLQTELQGLNDYAGRIQDGTRSLADQLDRIIDHSGELSDGISRAYDSLEESRILLDELGTIIRSLP